jgi:uncharacterized protein DUF4115
MPETRLERALFGVGLVVIAVLGLAIAHFWHHTTPSGAATAVSSTPTPGTTTATAIVPESAQGTTTTAVPRAGVGAKLSLTAARDTWVEIRSGSASGRILFTGMLGAGTEKTFTAPALWARFGAAADVAAQLNGRTLQLPAGTYNARFTSGGFRQVSG